MSSKISGTVGPCPHRGLVDCPVQERKCAKCGWNPEVTERRIKQIRRTTWFRAYVKRCGLEVR